MRLADAEGNAGRTLPRRERTTREGPHGVAPQLVEGGCESEAPTNEKSCDPLGKGSQL